MQFRTFNKLLLFSLFFMAHWFFGNLYEEVVLAPNQLTNAYTALKSWQGYFTVTNQVYYYVPFTQLAVFVVCFLYFKTQSRDEKNLLKKAGIFGLLSLGLTVIIITRLNLKLFFGDLERYKDEIFVLSVWWLIGNAIRICLTGFSLYFIFKTYILRVKKRENKHLQPS